jgi:hypothetical protein
VSADVAELLVGALLGDPPAVEEHDLLDLVKPDDGPDVIGRAAGQVMAVE